MKTYYPLYFILLVILLGCNRKNEAQKNIENKILKDSVKIIQLINDGEKAFATKSGYESISNALVFFDSAYQIALKNSNNYLMGITLYANGNIYNAWNKQPEKTIEYYTRAAELFAKDSNQFYRTQYLYYLIAHAYDKEKANDSLSCVTLLQNIYNTLIKKSKSQLKELDFVSDLAWVSTNINNYDFAEKILANLCNRAYIKNNSKTNNYLYHFYLTKARIDVFFKQNYYTPYLDSLEIAFKNSTTFLDSMYYSDHLLRLFTRTNRLKKVTYYNKVCKNFDYKLNTPNKLNSLQTSLLKMELNEEKRKQEIIKLEDNNRKKIVWFLTIALFIISILFIRIIIVQKKYKQLSKELAHTNTHLAKTVQEIDLLNKEMHHRIKNNLFMIFSLLQMQERNTSDSKTILYLKKARMRIEAIAQMHEEMLQQNTNFKNFITKILDLIIKCFNYENKIITYFEIEDIDIAFTNYFPLAVILNEWITNTIKHSQFVHEQTILNISIKQKDKKVILHYTQTKNNSHLDNISTKVENFKDEDFKTNSKGLGKKIVHLLVKQLQGDLININNNPYHYCLTFNTKK